MSSSDFFQIVHPSLSGFSRSACASRKHTALSNQRCESSNVLRDFDHKPVGEGLILKTLVDVVKKTTAKQRVIEKLMIGAGRDFEWVFNCLDVLKVEFLEPSSPILR